MMLEHSLVSRRSLDLLIVIALALVALVAALVGWETLLPVRLVAVPLVLFLPGYALISAIFSTSALELPEHFLFSVGLSFTITILGGFALNWSPWGLQTRSWMLLLASLTLLSSSAALARRRFLPVEPRPAVDLLVGRRQLLLLGIAGVITIGAVMVSRTGATRQEQAVARTQLWMLPAADTEQAAQLGVYNTETTPISYSLRLTLNGSMLQEWPLIELAPGQQWEQEITLGTAGPGDTVEALLYRTSEPGVVYRRVILRPVDQP